MKLQLVAVCTKMPDWVQTGFSEYLRRFPKDMPFELVEIPAGKRGKNADIKRILEKEGELNEDELNQVREHSYMTGEILSDYSELGDIINWASNHHEKLDGSGYPLHLEKDHLTLADRIISIADIFTALTEDRPYRKGMAWQEALQIMEADVINGALDSDVFLVLRHHAETLHAIILQTLEHPRSEHRP